AIGRYVQYLEDDLAPRARGPFRLGRERMQEKLHLEEGITFGPERLLAIAERELHATQEEFRRTASRLDARDPAAAWARGQAEHPPIGQVVATAHQPPQELPTFIPRTALV